MRIMITDIPKAQVDQDLANQGGGCGKFEWTPVEGIVRSPPDGWASKSMLILADLLSCYFSTILNGVDTL